MSTLTVSDRLGEALERVHALQAENDAHAQEIERLKADRDDARHLLERVCVALPEPPTHKQLPALVHEMRMELSDLRQRCEEAQAGIPSV